MNAWQPDGSAFFTLDARGAVVRHAADGGSVPAGRFPPERHARGLVFLGGRLRVVEAVEPDRCAVVDLETGATVHRKKIAGQLTHARVERPSLIHEYLMTRATHVASAGTRRSLERELAWFAFGAGELRRVHRLQRRTAPADDRPDAGARDLATAAVLGDGMLLDGEELVSPRAVGEERRRIERFTEAPLRAVVGEARTQARRIFLLGEDGLVTATAANGVRRWYGVRRAFSDERLFLSGDCALLCAFGNRLLTTWNADDGALVDERGLDGDGTLHPAPTGRHAVWLTEAGPQWIELAQPRPAPLALPASFDQSVRIEELALVVHGDTDGVLTDLVRQTAADGTSAEDLTAEKPQYRTPTLAVASLTYGPRQLLEPWTVTRARRPEPVWIEGFTLRRLVEEGRAQGEELARRLGQRAESRASAASLRETRSALRVSAELEASILAAPDAEERYLVYGDWLLEHGDPRGELVTLQARLQAHPEDADLRERERALLQQHGPGWLGTLSGKLAGDWRSGFLRSVDLTIGARGWRDLVSLPVLRFVRSLKLTITGDEAAFFGEVQRLGWPPLLQTLAVSTYLEDAGPLLVTLPTSPVRTLAVKTEAAGLLEHASRLGRLVSLRLLWRASAEDAARIRCLLPDLTFEVDRIR